MKLGFEVDVVSVTCRHKGSDEPAVHLEVMGAIESNDDPHGGVLFLFLTQAEIPAWAQLVGQTVKLEVVHPKDAKTRKAEPSGQVCPECEHRNGTHSRNCQAQGL